MMAFGLAGAALLVPASPVANAFGFGFLYLAFLLDKVDGEIARLKGTQNARGIFLDRMHHRLVEPCLFLAVALHEHLLSGMLLPLLAGFTVVLLANAIEENQHLVPYIVFKRAREGAPLPAGAPPRSAGWTRAAALLRPLKGFRMFIVALPLAALAYAVEWTSGVPWPTLVLLVSAAGLLVYLAFQCAWYLGEQVDQEASSVAAVLRAALGVLVILGATAGTAQAAGTYYVDGGNPTCSDGGPGTLATPYCTIGAAVAARAGAGTTIHVAPGHYQEQVTIPASGTAGNPFVLQGDGTFGNPVLVDGGESLSSPALWTLATGTTWLATSVTWNALMVSVDGVRFVSWGGAPDSVPVGGFRMVPGTGLYVNTGSANEAGNPGRRVTTVGRLQYGVLMMNRSWVTIRGLTVLHSNDRGIQVTNSSHVVLEGNTVEGVQRFGIQAQGSSDVLVHGNRVTGSGDHGISITLGTTASTIEDNESDHNARPGQRAANGLILFAAPKNVVRRNRFHHNQDSGMHVQAGSDSVVSTRNLSYANGDHGFDHLAVQGGIHLGDVAWGNAIDGFSFEGVAPAEAMYDCISAENGRYQLFVDSSSVAGWSSNDNIFRSVTGEEPIKFDKVEYATVAAFAAATGNDTRTFQGDPLFAAPEVGDFHVLAGSPAIDAANTGFSQWLPTDFEGYAPLDDGATPNSGTGPVQYADRGAFEHGSGGIVDVPDGPPSVVIEGVAPNPLQGKGVLSFRTARSGPLTVDLYDARGRRVARLLEQDRAPAGSFALPVVQGALPPGIYLWRVLSADGERAGKFVVVR
jgi:phosphatidylglycerophosphate synthase